MKTLKAAEAIVARYRDETIKKHDFDIGGDRETEICIFLEWLYNHNFYVGCRDCDEEWMERNRPSRVWSNEGSPVSTIKSGEEKNHGIS